MYLSERYRLISRRKKILHLLCSLIKRRQLITKSLMLLEMFLTEWDMQGNIDSIVDRKQRICRRFPRNTGWWDTVWGTYSDESFKKKFRVSKETFCFILEKINHRILKEERCETPISPEMRLGICLYKLGRGDYNFTVAELAGIAESTVCVIIKEVCLAIVEEMWNDHVECLFPKTREEFISIMADMEAHWQFGFAFCGIDGSHIPIKCPAGGAVAMKQYYNFKNFYSVVLLALVDANYRFIWASCGAPGNTHDSTYFQSTNIWEKICNGTLLPNDIRTVGGDNISPINLGDGAFPMRSWLMKPYGDAILSEEKRYFNYRLSRARMVTEGAFGKLKSRFRVLHRKCESHKDTVKIMTLACVVIHNLSISRGDILTRKFDLMIDSGTQKMRTREQIRDILDMSDTSHNFIQAPSSTAKEVRDKLRDIFWAERNSDE